jgi:hypothetical protein
MKKGSLPQMKVSLYDGRLPPHFYALLNFISKYGCIRYFFIIPFSSYLKDIN